MEEDATPSQSAGGPDAGSTPSGLPVPSPGAPGTPPTPRRDPYADFGNPLHDTWGTRTTQSPGPVPPAHVGKQRKKRPGVRWAVTILVIALLAIAGWFARGAIGDAWDRVYDKAANVTGDSDNAPDPTAPATQPTGLDPEDVARAADANDAAFDDWMDANEDTVTAASDRVAAASGSVQAMVTGTSSGEAVGQAGYRASLVELRDSILGEVNALNDAPPSAVRDDFVRILLVQMNQTNRLIEASDAGDPAGVETATRDLQSAGAETLRLCRQYGDRARALCE